MLCMYSASLAFCCVVRHFVGQHFLHFAVVDSISHPTSFPFCLWTACFVPQHTSHPPCPTLCCTAPALPFAKLCFLAICAFGWDLPHMHLLLLHFAVCMAFSAALTLLFAKLRHAGMLQFLPSLLSPASFYLLLT